MEPTKKSKVKYFNAGIAERKMETEVNHFLEQNPSINVKGIAINYHDRVLLLYEE